MLCRCGNQGDCFQKRQTAKGLRVDEVKQVWSKEILKYTELLEKQSLAWVYIYNTAKLHPVYVVLTIIIQCMSFMNSLRYGLHVSLARPPKYNY